MGEEKPIPPECKRLMRMSKGRELGSTSDWKHFKFHYNKLELPTGLLVTAQQLLLAMALLEVKPEVELKTTSKVIRYSRSIANILSRTESRKY